MHRLNCSSDNRSMYVSMLVVFCTLVAFVMCFVYPNLGYVFFAVVIVKLHVLYCVNKCFSGKRAEDFETNIQEDAVSSINPTVRSNLPSVQSSQPPSLLTNVTADGVKDTDVEDAPPTYEVAVGERNPELSSEANCNLPSYESAVGNEESLTYLECSAVDCPDNLHTALIDNEAEELDSVYCRGLDNAAFDPTADLDTENSRETGASNEVNQNEPASDVTESLIDVASANLRATEALK